MTPRRIVASSLLMLAILASCIGMWPIYRTPQLIVCVAVAALAGAAIAVAGALRRWPAIGLIGLGALAFLVLAVPLAAPARMAGAVPTVEGFATVLGAVVLAWRRLLTIELPVGTIDGLLVVPMLIVLAGTIAGVTITLRWRREEWAATIPAAIVVIFILLGPREEAWPVAAGVLVAACVVGLITQIRATRTRHGSRRARHTVTMRVVAGVATGVVAMAVAVGAGSAVPLGDREVLRAEGPSAFDPASLASPLSSFRSYLGVDERTEPLMTVTGLTAGQPVRLAALDAYDGQVFGVGSDASFVRIPAQVDATGEDHLGVTVQGLTGIWVPSVGDVGGVQFIGQDAIDLQESLHLDRSTETIAAIGSLSSGDAYQLIADVEQPPASLAELTPAGTPTASEQLPSSMIDRLGLWTADAGSPGSRLQAMVEGFALDGYISHGIDDDEEPSRAGHSLARLDDLFTGIMVGDAEQYAAAAALLARELGFPSRVVMGFTPEITPGVPTTVVGGDVDAWIEVQTAEAGWVAVQVTPEPRPIPEQDARQPQPVTQPAQPPAPDLPAGGTEDARGPSSPIEPPPIDDDADGLGTIVAIATGIAALLLLVIAPIAVLLLLKWLRRRRLRSAATAAGRLSGAWQDLVDGVVDHGGDPPGTLTRLEYAGADAGRAELADRVDRGVFGADGPSDADVDDAWRRADELRQAMDSRVTRRARLAARLSPRSLSGRRGMIVS